LGQIQICVEKANPNAKVTVFAAAGATTIQCDTPSQFNPGDLLILGTFAATAKTHAIGDELLKISRAYDDSNIVDGTKIQYPLADRQSAINRVNVSYYDAPTGFEQRTLYVNDYPNQAKVHAINDQDLDGSA